MSEATTAGRGVIYIAFAKLYFMIAGYAIYFTLPRLLGTEVSWGNYLLVIGLVSVVDNVIVTGTIQGVSKFTAQGDAHPDAVKRAALRAQLLLGGGIALLYLVAAPWIAAWERDLGLLPMYRLSAGIVLCYSFYAVFVGSLNGQRFFGRQAALDVGFATIRAALILGAAGIGLGVIGAVGGFVAAAAVILVVSALWVGIPFKAPPFDVKRIWTFTAYLFVYTLALNLVMRVDLFLIKRLAGAMVGGDAAAQAAAASAAAGYYGTAQSLAFIPYQAILAIAFVIFPLVSRSTFEQDLDATRSYIRQTLRLSLIFAAALAVVFAANPEAVLNVPYPQQYRIGGPALRILAAGMLCFSMFTIINTILNGAGKTRLTIFAAIVTLALDVVANSVLIPRAGSPAEVLVAAATATSAAMAVGVALSTILLFRAFGAAFPALTVLRVLVAAGAAVALGGFIGEVSKLVTLAECVAVSGVFVLVLVMLGEFSRADLANIKQILSRRKSP